jgi:hypothetical protein
MTSRPDSVCMNTYSEHSRGRSDAASGLGNGLPLFKDLARPLRLDLTEAKSFPGGTVIHVYRPIRTTRQ